MDISKRKKNINFVLRPHPLQDINKIKRDGIIKIDNFLTFQETKQISEIIKYYSVPKNDPIRRQKNILFSSHRAGALNSVFFEMGEIVYEDLNLITKGLPPKLCRRGELETVKNLRSKPVVIN